MVYNNPSLSSCLKMSGHLPPDEWFYIRKQTNMSLLNDKINIEVGSFATGQDNLIYM